MQTPEEYLCAVDPKLAELILRQGTIVRGSRGTYFTALCSSIISQQLSLASAATIFARFEQATGLDPEKVLGMDEVISKAIGLSRQKTAYLKDLARHFIDDPDVYSHFERSTDEQVIAELTAIKGIGVWTAQMFLMFTLQRPDVFAPDDVGLQNAMKRLYGWEVMPSKKELETIAEVWKPYRTLASWHLWQSLTPAVRI